MVTANEQFLDQSVEVLQGIGPTRAKALSEVGVHTIGDLLYYFPRRYLDRSTVSKIADLQSDQLATVVGKVVGLGIKKGRRNRFILTIADGSGFLNCVWFSQLSYWGKIFHVGDWLAVSGKVSYYHGLQMTHPEFDRLGNTGDGDLVHTGKIIPLYPSTEALTKVGLDSRGFRRMINALLKRYGNKIPEILPASCIERLQLISRAQALRQIHFPTDFAELQRAQQRLKFDELFFMEMLVALRKRHYNSLSAGIRFEKVGEHVKTLIESLPFELTEAQKRVLRHIRADMKSPKPMNRLLQGDVGSGKTIVALISMLIAVENGYQAALMAPTEILAEQHYFTIRGYLQQIPIEVALLVGGQSRSEREYILQRIANGQINIVIGTHALIQEGVTFQQLGLVIIDEQHRFGVMQRAVLREKGLNPDVLVMTATPIPRTLAMTIYGDLDISVLDELPANRRPVKTYWRNESQRSKIYHFVRKQVSEGAQAFIVFPLVEETEKSDLKAATDSYQRMKETFFKSFRLGLLHGRMRSDEKEAVMTAFKNHELDILVTTSVVEVGVDVPNATLMVIEHAERFGLTQLHQLRGRVGRGEKQSYCILIAYGELSAEARTRLDTMTRTNDGFQIAEVDLQLRGPGEFFGTKQHGLPELKLADPSQDIELLRLAREEAFRIVDDDPQLLRQTDAGLRRHFIKNYQEKFGFAWVG